MSRALHRAFGVVLMMAVSCGTATSSIHAVPQAAGHRATLDAPGLFVPWSGQPDTVQFEQRIRSAFGDRLVAAWPSAGGVLNVQIVDPSPCEREVVAQLASVYGVVGSMVSGRASWHPGSPPGGVRNYR